MIKVLKRFGGVNFETEEHMSAEQAFAQLQGSGEIPAGAEMHGWQCYPMRDRATNYWSWRINWRLGK